MYQNGNNTETLAKGRLLSSSVHLSCCHLLPHATEIWEKADKIISVPFQASQVQGRRVLEPGVRLAIHCRVSCVLDIYNSPSMLWLAHVGSLYVFEIDTDKNIDIASSSQKKQTYWRPWNSVNIYFLLPPLVCGKSISPRDFDLDVVTCFGQWNMGSITYISWR